MTREDKIRIAFEMLGETIDFYNDGGNEVSIAYYNGIEQDLIDSYNTAIESIQKRYEVLGKFIKGEEML